MSTPYIGEIRMFGFSRVPTGWVPCDGRLLSIAEYEVLFVLIGTTYGGDGQNTFAVPDLRGRVPVHTGQGPGLSVYVLGQQAGTETVTLTAAQMPLHQHPASATSAAASTGTPGNSVVPGTVANQTMYATNLTGATPFTQSASAITPSGGSQPHENCMPTLTVQYCIAWAGIFPSQN
ncbi:phage tail protein [Arenimonas sp. MALMAid1274]|uniref:phage tail protein n=1 Tax=Arenimonas sp. MALMAid1274 TaxID=3411630 RepID=UPI003BA02A1B